MRRAIFRVGTPLVCSRSLLAFCLAGMCRRCRPPLPPPPASVVRTRAHAVSFKFPVAYMKIFDCPVHLIGEMKAISVLLSLAVLVAVVCAGVKKAQRTVHSDNLVAYGNSFIAERFAVEGTLSQELMFDCFTAVAKQGDDDDDDASSHFVRAANTNGFRLCTAFEMLAILQNQPTHHFPAGNASFVTFSSADGDDISVMIIEDGAYIEDEEEEFEEPGTFYAFCCSARLILGTVGEGDDK
jgi:hypothetical protein